MVMTPLIYLPSDNQISSHDGSFKPFSCQLYITTASLNIYSGQFFFTSCHYYMFVKIKNEYGLKLKGTTVMTDMLNEQKATQSSAGSTARYTGYFSHGIYNWSNLIRPLRNHKIQWAGWTCSLLNQHYLCTFSQGCSLTYGIQVQNQYSRWSNTN